MPYIRIISRPPGYECIPDDIQEAWIGLVLPLAPPTKGRSRWEVNEYLVRFRDALPILGTKSSKARDYWEWLGVKHGKIGFDRGCAELVVDETDSKMQKAK